MTVEFQRAFIAKNEIEYVQSYLSSDRKAVAETLIDTCKESLSALLDTSLVHLTSSCTASLEIACLLSGIDVGDEVILPSYTFSSTANAVALRGATPVFVDIKPSTLNIDEALVEQAITKRTKAIIAVHYAGMSCNMNVLSRIAREHNLLLIEDAAQGLGTTYFGQPLGTLGDFGAISFHQTKNVHCGEGGAFIARDLDMYEKAAHIIEKGTNRLDLIKGKVSKYHWVRLGSSYVLSEMQTALLAAQLEAALQITTQREQIWHCYHEGLHRLAHLEKIKQPSIEPGSTVNGHIYYVLIDSHYSCQNVQQSLAQQGVSAYTHYEPLHLSPAGQDCGRSSGTLTVTEDISKRLLRLPLWPEMNDDDVHFVITCLENSLN